MAGCHDADIIIFRKRQMCADVQIIAENDAFGLRIVFRRSKIGPVIIDHNTEIDRGQHRHERRADMAAAEDIRIACPRERFDIIARLPLFRDRIRTKHRTQFAQRDTIRETQAVRLIIGSHRTDTAFIHTVDKPAVLIAVQQVQNAAQKRGIRFGLRVKILEEDRHIAAADHADVRDLVGSQAVTVDEGLLRFQNLHRQLPGFQLDRAAADGALRMAIGEDSHFCARTARRGTG